RVRRARTAARGSPTRSSSPPHRDRRRPAPRDRRARPRAPERSSRALPEKWGEGQGELLDLLTSEALGVEAGQRVHRGAELRGELLEGPGGPFGLRVLGLRQLE